MIDDFPAAHSMDTDWFAVDADGCVGLFSSGEEAPVPIDAALMLGYGGPYSVFDDDDENRSDIRSSSINGSYLARRAGVAAPSAQLWATLETATCDGLFVLSDDATIDDLLGKDIAAWVKENDSYAVRYAGTPAVYFLMNCDVTQLRAACDQGIVTALRLTGWSAYDLEIAALGLFLFQGVFGNKHYTRSNLPEQPTRLNDLPPELASRLATCAFSNTSFADESILFPTTNRHCRKYGLSRVINPTHDSVGHVAVFLAHPTLRNADRYVSLSLDLPNGKYYSKMDVEDVIGTYSPDADGIMHLDIGVDRISPALTANEKPLHEQQSWVDKLDHSALCIFKDEASLPNYMHLPQFNAFRLAGSEPIYVLHGIGNYYAGLLQQARDEGQIKFMRELDLFELLADVFGFYIYATASEDCAIFERVRTPAHPSLSASLPAVIRAEFATSPFLGIRFDETETIVAAEFVTPRHSKLG
ncbi:MAG: hypothetical protein JO142_17010 [Burkholderiales bacterium]|nr:hypothetical protein [Burkholderiales bacterium]